jgi:hypothetical protein
MSRTSGDRWPSFSAWTPSSSSCPRSASAGVAVTTAVSASAAHGASVHVHTNPGTCRSGVSGISSSTSEQPRPHSNHP